MLRFDHVTACIDIFDDYAAPNADALPLSSWVVAHGHFVVRRSAIKCVRANTSTEALFLHAFCNNSQIELQIDMRQ